MWGRWGCVSSVCGVSPSRPAGVCRRADPEPDAELASLRRFLTVTPGLNRYTVQATSARLPSKQGIFQMPPVASPGCADATTSRGSPTERSEDSSRSGLEQLGDAVSAFFSPKQHEPEQLQPEMEEQEQPALQASENASGDISLEPPAEDECDCAICLVASPALNTPLLITHCGHQFCGQCLGLYATKQPANTPVLCPLCRSQLGVDDIPTSVTLSVQRTAGVPLGVLFSSGQSDEHADIAGITPGSNAEKAGLRVGMQLLAIDDVAIRAHDDAHDLMERLRGTGEGVVRLHLRVPRPPTAADVAAAEADRLAAFLAATPIRGARWIGWAAWCCCCNATAQIYARAFHKTRHTCLALAATLWSCFLVFVTADILGDVLAERAKGRTTVGESCLQNLPAVPACRACLLWQSHSGLCALARVVFLRASRPSSPYASPHASPYASPYASLYASPALGRLSQWHQRRGHKVAVQ